MHILYVAKHHSGGNDDEGAVAHALRQLKHDVRCVQESEGSGYVSRKDFDLLLCHHWTDYAALERAEMSCVFWCFDKIDFPDDPTLLSRSRQRITWLWEMKRVCTLGFLTDGDQVAADTSGKLHWLPQGADERIVGRGDPESPPCLIRDVSQGGKVITVDRPDILLLGRRRGGSRRESFVDELAERYRTRFCHVGKGLHREQARDAVARARIVVAPDWPRTDKYWSNRVYNTLGFGGFLLHPWSEGLTKHYCAPHEVLFYRSREDLHRLIDFYSQESYAAYAEQTKFGGLERTKQHHLYRHRVEELLRVVADKLGVR